MAGKGWSVGRCAEVVGFARTAVRARDERVLIHVLVDPSCPRELVLAVKDALVPTRGGGQVRVMPLAGSLPPAEAPDVALALMGPGSEPAGALAYARRGVPVALVVEGALDVALPEVPEDVSARLGVVAASSPEVLADKLALWLASAVEKEIALAANFPFCRRAVTQRLIARCALQNAAVGAVHLIPGSDLPVMTANQAKLALDIADRERQPVRLNDIERGGDGNGDDAVLAANRTRSVDEARHDDAGDVEVGEAHGNSYDVDDGIDGTYLVEVNLIERDGVRLGLGMRDDVHHAMGQLARPRRQLAGIDDGVDVRGAAMLVMMVVMAVLVSMVVAVVAGAPLMAVPMVVVVGVLVVMGATMVVVIAGVVMPVAVTMVVVVPMEVRHIVVVVLVRLIEHHIEVAAVDTRLLDAAYAHLVAIQRQARERIAQARLVGARIEQRRDGHIAADAVRAIQIERLSHSFPFLPPLEAGRRPMRHRPPCVRRQA